MLSMKLWTLGSRPQKKSMSWSHHFLKMFTPTLTLLCIFNVTLSLNLTPAPNPIIHNLTFNLDKPIFTSHYFPKMTGHSAHHLLIKVTSSLAFRFLMVFILVELWAFRLAEVPPPHPSVLATEFFTIFFLYPVNQLSPSH